MHTSQQQRSRRTCRRDFSLEVQRPDVLHLVCAEQLEEAPAVAIGAPADKEDAAAGAPRARPPARAAAWPSAAAAAAPGAAQGKQEIWAEMTTGIARATTRWPKQLYTCHCGLCFSLPPSSLDLELRLRT